MPSVVIDPMLRALVADVVERHLRTGSREYTGPSAVSTHASHALLPMSTGSADGACVIEPAVRCTHCGYCKSYGH